MPFWYHLPVPPLDEPQPATVRLAEWLLDVGAEVHQGTRVAVSRLHRADTPSARMVTACFGSDCSRWALRSTCTHSHRGYRCRWRKYPPWEAVRVRCTPSSVVRWLMALPANCTAGPS